MFEVSKEFCEALKAADRAVTVWMNPAEPTDTDTRHAVIIRMIATAKATVPSGFIVDTPGCFLESEIRFSYRSRDPIQQSGYKSASFCTLYPYSGAWKALSLILRPGDLLTLVAMDDRTENLKERDLHADTLYAMVTRKGKVILDMFPVEYSAGCPDNSARSLKR